MTKWMWAPAVCLALGAAGAVRAALPPVDADPNQAYAVTPDAGPWMICAAYFTGPAAPDLAHQMVLQIRSRYNRHAYVFNYADEERKREQALIDQQHQALPFDAPPDGSDEVVPIPHHHLVVHVEEQCAVLIGGYPNGYSDEKAAHADLLLVKKWPAPDLKAPEGVLPFGSLVVDGKDKPINPFALQSMVVRNPTVPHDNSAADPRKDKFLWTLNAGEEYSMLACPGKYTLAVREYLGASVVREEQAESSGFLKMIGLGNSLGSNRAGESLAVAAQNAHELAKGLHQAGFDAYVLHTRTSSVVSIGSFSGPKDKTAEDTAERLARWRQQIAAATADPTKKDPLGLFACPVLVEVPHPDR
jgi:hypothetical protein